MCMAAPSSGIPFDHLLPVCRSFSGPKHQKSKENWKFGQKWMNYRKNWVYKRVSVRSSWKQKWYSRPWGHVRARSIGVALSMAPQRRYSGQAKKKLVGGAMCPSWKMMDFVNGKDDSPVFFWENNVWHTPNQDFSVVSRVFTSTFPWFLHPHPEIGSWNLA
jgi:hypothetical protein